ncbi:MAG: hypothetical protein K2H32_09340 [Muribaculaceae bacterium]|nr:hypothetical protein [Muribaculaceae bacterium]
MEKKNKQIKRRLFSRTSVPLGFVFSIEDELDIEQSCRASEKWMKEKYGKGKQPGTLGVGDN